MNVIFQTVLIVLCDKYYEHRIMFDETTVP